jgi:putative selenate reductase molybdopterin-binding subunit
MKLSLNVNGNRLEIEAEVNARLLDVLRSAGYFGVKHGCDDGTCGACAVLVAPDANSPGKAVNSCTLLAVQAEGLHITTIAGLGGPQQHGWKGTEPLHALQQAFIETGAIQCGYCTPAQILAAKALLDREPNPTEEQVRDALSGVLCRCTGYVKPVEAVLQAAAVMRGTAPLSSLLPTEERETAPFPLRGGRAGDEGEGDTLTQTHVLPKMIVAPTQTEMHVFGKPEVKVDAVKLAQGKPAFTDDIELRGMLVGKILHSPVAHARVKRIDASKARALPGVATVLTWQDIPRVVYSTAGQSDPIPGPLDMFSLDNKVRFVGDRVAFVAAETEEIAQRALDLVAVEYEELPAILDPREAIGNQTLIHDEPEYMNFADSDPRQNLAAKIRIDIGDVEAGFRNADRIFEDEYTVPKVQQAHIEPHVCVTYWDEDDRLVIRTSTQVPFHVRRILARVLGLPPKRIRVIKPRIGGGFGGKQEVLIEDVCAHLTIATGRPVRLEYTREEEFTAARSRHPMRVKMKTGVKSDGTITANEMIVLSDTGAYGCHALTVTGNTGHKAMALYPAYGIDRGAALRVAPPGVMPNVRFYADIVYTNTPPSGAFRGYGVPQGFFPVETHMEYIARELGLDPLEFRLKNALRAGEEHPFSRSWSEGREPRPETIQTCALAECAAQGAAAIEFDRLHNGNGWRSVPGKPWLRKGLGVALVMQGTAIPYLDMGAASIKMNDDGSFNVLVGATDLGTGSDTVLGQMAAEVLGVPLDDILMYSSDTDFTPFDKGAYASSTTYISGAAVVKAAQLCAEQIKEVAAQMLNARRKMQDAGCGAQDTIRLEDLTLRDKKAIAPDGGSVTLEEIALESLHHSNQRQIMAAASYMSPVSPPPFAAQFAEVTVDTETGQVTVDKLVMALDCGRIVNPATASGQIEGGMAQALGYGVCEEMLFDAKGRVLNPRFDDYRILRADEMPQMTTIFVETNEPSHPFGVKAVAEIPMDGVAPAVANAVYDAVGVRVKDLPLTPEKVWRGMREA